MKKIFLCLISLSLVVAVLVSCDSSSSSTSTQMLESTTNASSASEASKATDIPSESMPPASVPSEPELLSVDDAIAIYNTWLDNHDELSSYTLDAGSHQLFELLGEQYYLFSANADLLYWYNILVHTETGELLFMMTSDGEHPTTSVEPLDDWYDSNFAA